MKIQKYKWEIQTWYSPKRLMIEYIKDYFWHKKGDKIWYIFLHEDYDVHFKGACLMHRKSGPAHMRINGDNTWHYKNHAIAHTEEEFYNK